MISHCYPLLNLFMDIMDWKVKDRITLIPRRISPASELRNAATEENKMVWPISKPAFCRINKAAAARTCTLMLLMPLSHSSIHSIVLMKNVEILTLKPNNFFPHICHAWVFFYLSSRIIHTKKSDTWKCHCMWVFLILHAVPY